MRGGAEYADASIAVPTFAFIIPHLAELVDTSYLAAAASELSESAYNTLIYQGVDVCNLCSRWFSDTTHGHFFHFNHHVSNSDGSGSVVTAVVVGSSFAVVAVVTVVMAAAFVAVAAVALVVVAILTVVVVAAAVVVVAVAVFAVAVGWLQ
jgi:hypothetical protein